jgi:hypothetical protein
MRPFELEPGMKTMMGVFYPTGWTLLMFPGEQAARDAAKLLEDGGLAEGDILLVTPEDFRRDIVGATGDDNMLPSAGTEGDTVRQFSDLAREGHHGLLIHAPEADHGERIMELLRDCKISYGQKWRTLVIEDIVS